MRGQLILGQARLQELHEFPVSGVTDCADLTEAFLLVLVLDRTRFHHRRHAVSPVDLRLFEDLDHVDVDKVDAELHAFDAALFHFLLDRVGELRHLLGRSRAGCALDPRVRITDVFFRNPRRMLFDVQTDVALFEQNRRVVATQQAIAQARLQLVPARGQGAGDVTDVFVIHQQHRAQAVRLHALAGTLEPVRAHPAPVNALLPVQTHHAYIGHNFLQFTC